MAALNTGQFPTAPNVTKYIFSTFYMETLYAACKLGIFDAVHEAGDWIPAKTIGEKIGGHVPYVERLLRACARIKLLHVKDDNGQLLFKTTDESAMFLTSTSERSMQDFIYLAKGDWDNLIEVIKNGKPEWGSMDAEDPFPEMEEESFWFFHNGMNGKCQDMGNFVHAFDFSSFKSLIDCGGGLGANAKAMKQAYPHMDVSVVETGSFIAKMRKKKLPETVIYIEGDFFKQLPSADLYLLCNIIHDWNEEKVDLILTNVYNALPSGGGIILMEKLYNEEIDIPFAAAMDIALLPILYGKERTRKEYGEILTKPGFTDIKFHLMPYCSADVIYARKP